jgi:hypothetical protein
MIKSIDYDQHDIIKNIIELHCPEGITLDPTYSKGNFYNKSGVTPPTFKYDLFPQTIDTIKSDANDLQHDNDSIKTIMFDPPFMVGYTKETPTGILGERFNGFRYIDDLWKWYSECLVEFHRVLEPNGTLIFKCQDTVSSGKQWFSHLFIMNEAEKLGYYNKDLFILLAKNRIIGHNHSNQQHARKFHSYFIVLKKVKPNLKQTVTIHSKSLKNNVTNN